MSEDLVTKFDCLNARFKAEYEQYRALNLEERRTFEEFERCPWWRIWRTKKLARRLYELWDQISSKLRVAMAVHEELVATRTEMETLLLSVKRDLQRMQ